MVRSLADRTFQLRSQRPVAVAASAGPLEASLRPPLPAVVKIGMFMPLAEACRARHASARGMNMPIFTTAGSGGRRLASSGPADAATATGR